MRIDPDIKLDFKDVLIRPKRSTLISRADVSLEREYLLYHTKTKWTGIPVISSNMDTVGTFEMAKVLISQQCLTAIHKHYTIEDWTAFANQVGQEDLSNYVALSMGTSHNDLDKTRAILTLVPHIRFLMVDVANGYSESFVTTVWSLRQSFPDKVIIAGNVVTAEMTEELILSGADIVKVGIGSGSACKTRTQTGVGYPQLSAIIECADAAHGVGGLVMSDGGCTVPGDLAKAFGAGADFVMLGGMLAGHDESGGKLVEFEGQQYKEFYGMSSQKAMNKYHGGMAEYRSSEGKELRIPYRGPVINTLQQILGGLRSACTYVGAKFLKELSKRTTFIRVTQQINNVYG